MHDAETSASLENLALNQRTQDPWVASGTASPTAPEPASPMAAGAGTVAAVSAPRRGLWLLGLLLLLAAGLYFLLFTPRQGADSVVVPGVATGIQSGGVTGQASAGAAKQGPTVVDGLADRLKSNPNDGEGWAMLARSYRVMGRTAEALDAYQKAQSILGDDPGLLADYAETMALQHDGRLSGEPMKLLQRAILKDGKHIKTLYLLGQQAFADKNYTLAVRQWEKAIKASPANHPQTPVLQARLAEARRLAGLPAQTSADVKPGASTRAAESISGTVTLAENLVSQVQPEDTVFIMATPSDGGRMPIAVLRRQVKDLPIRFMLDDRLAMSPDTRLSRLQRVNLSARVSKTGNALPVPGDFTGQLTAVSIGTQDVSIVIQDKVKP